MQGPLATSFVASALRCNQPLPLLVAAVTLSLACTPRRAEMPDVLARDARRVAARNASTDVIELGAYRLVRTDVHDAFTPGAMNLFGKKPDRHRRTFRVHLEQGTPPPCDLSCTVEYSWIRDTMSAHLGERDKKVWLGCTGATGNYTLSSNRDAGYSGTLAANARTYRLVSVDATGNDPEPAEPGGFVLHDGDRAVAGVDERHRALLLTVPDEPALLALLGSLLFFSPSPPRR